MLVMPTRPAAFHTRRVIELRWAPFICLASPRSTCTEVSLLQEAPRSHWRMPAAAASRSSVARRAGASRPWELELAPADMAASMVMAGLAGEGEVAGVFAVLIGAVVAAVA